MFISISCPIANLPLNGILMVLTAILTEEQKKEELEKLYSAVGYSEAEVITAFPKEVDPIFSCSYSNTVNPDIRNPFVTRSLVQ